ncbi:substrate-binding domain-containing protein [Candidatus Bathyarchaeota archaeon]|nr:substrate-binding domain-containing protein [Candidatus Bathyarchaeota archaeon]
MNTKTVLVAVILIFAGFASYTYLAKPEQETATITVSGAFALYPLMIEWGDEYHSLHPEVKFEISAGGAGKGMTDALSELVDLGMISREIYPAEVEKGAVWVAVAKDAVVITVNEDNPVLEDLLSMGLTPEKIESIFVTGNTVTWGELVERPEVTDKINVYTRSDACGAAATIATYMGYNQEDLLGTGVYGDPGLAEAVKSDAYAIGYNNVNYAYDVGTGEAVEGIVVVPLDLDGSGVVTADEDFYESREEIIDAIADGRYPEPPARELNLVTKDSFDGVTLEFIKWILTEGQGLAVEAGYVPVSQAKAEQELAKLGY